MNDSSGRGSSSSARSSGTGGQYGPAVPSALSRLIRGGAAYQSPALVSGLLALVTLPLYTRELTPADLGVAETVLTFIILGSIVLRGGLAEALVRLWFTEEDAEARARMARTALGTVAVVTTLVALAALPFAAPLADVLCNRHDAGIGRLAILGLWSFTNLETAYALLRVEERRAAFVRASMANVLLTVALTVTLVVFLDGGAHGYLAGNYVASALVLLGIWATEVRRIGVRGGRYPLSPMLRYGLPIVPAEAAVFALNVIDRAYLLRAESAAAAGLFALAVKLATVVIVAVRAFGLAWPPLAYSVTDDDEARRLYATVTTWYVVIIGLVVLGAGAAVALDRRPPGGTGLRRRARGAGLGRARLGPLRARAPARHGRGPRAHHDPQRAGRVRRARRERRRPAPARPAARDRRGGDRALRRLRRHARGPAPADARALPRPVRVGPSGAGDARPGRRGARRRAPPARRRGRRAGVARRARRARARRPVSHRIPAS